LFGDVLGPFVLAFIHFPLSFASPLLKE